MRDFRELAVWHKSHRLTLAVYEITSQFPRQHSSGLSGQMQRAAVSMTTAIAEAASRSDRLEFIKSLRTALGWSNQLEYEILLARDLRLIDDSHHDSMQSAIIEVKKMLNGLAKTAGLQEH